MHFFRSYTTTVKSFISIDSSVQDELSLWEILTDVKYFSRINVKSVEFQPTKHHSNGLTASIQQNKDVSVLD